MSTQPVPSGNVVSGTLLIGSAVTANGIPSNAIPGGAASISMEKGTLSDNVYRTSNTTFIGVLNTLSPSGGVLRIGGNSVDDSIWIGTGTGGVAGQVATGDIDNLAAFLMAVGNWKVLYAINLGGTSPQGRNNGPVRGQTPAKGLAELSYLWSKLNANGNGDKYFYGYEIGNECNIYNHGSCFNVGSYSISGNVITFTGVVGGLANTYNATRNYFQTTPPVTGALMTFSTAASFSPAIPGLAGKSFALLSGATQGSATQAAVFSIEVDSLASNFDGQSGSCHASVAYGASSGQPANDLSFYANMTPIWQWQDFTTLWLSMQSQIATNKALAPYCTGPASAMYGNDFKYWTVPFANAVGGPAQNGPLQVITQHQGYGCTNVSDFLQPGGDSYAPYIGQGFAHTTASALGAQAKINGSKWRFSETENSGGSGVNLAYEYASALWAIDFCGFAFLYGGQGTQDHGQGYLGGPSKNSPLYTPIYNSYANGKMTGPVTAVNAIVYGKKLFDMAGSGPMLGTTLHVPATGTQLNITSFAIQTSATTMSVLINNKDVTANSHAFITLTAGQNISNATLLELTQGTSGTPDLTYPATLQNPTAITIGGSTIGKDGTFTPNPPYTLTPQGNTVTFYARNLSPVLVKITFTTLTISSATPLPQGTVGTNYTTALTASGGVTPYIWSLSTGSLPPGLSLSSAGVISGTPTTAASYSFTLKCVDASGSAVTKAVVLAVAADTLSISTSPNQTAVVGSPFSLVLQYTGGTGHVTWSIPTGTLPSTLTFSNGIISGTPVIANVGTYTFTIRATDSSNTPQSVNLIVTLTVNYAPLVVTTPATLMTATVNSAYSQTLAASGGKSPYTWALDTSTMLPMGLTISSTGIISGTPRTIGNYTFLINVSDSSSRSTSMRFNLAVNNSSLSIATPGTLLAGGIGLAYSLSLSGSGGTQPYSWSIGSGALPPGLMLSSAGTISGTPTALGNYAFQIRLTDNVGNVASENATLLINPSPLSASSQLPNDLEVGIAQSVSLTASGGVSPYTYAVAPGSSLPSGLTLDSTGLIKGVPLTPGSFTINFLVSDSASQQFTLTQSVVVAPHSPITYVGSGRTCYVPTPLNPAPWRNEN